MENMQSPTKQQGSALTRDAATAHRGTIESMFKRREEAPAVPPPPPPRPTSPCKRRMHTDETRADDDSSNAAETVSASDASAGSVRVLRGIVVAVLGTRPGGRQCVVFREADVPSPKRETNRTRSKATEATALPTEAPKPVTSPPKSVTSPPKPVKLVAVEDLLDMRAGGSVKGCPASEPTLDSRFQQHTFSSTTPGTADDDDDEGEDLEESDEEDDEEDGEEKDEQEEDDDWVVDDDKTDSDVCVGSDDSEKSDSDSPTEEEDDADENEEPDGGENIADAKKKGEVDKPVKVKEDRKPRHEDVRQPSPKKRKVQADTVACGVQVDDDDDYDDIVKWMECDKTVQVARAVDEVVPKAAAVPVNTGREHRLIGKFPTTCPLVVLDVRVRDAGTVVGIVDVHRTWTAPMTRKKLTDGLSLRGFGGENVTKALRVTGGRITDPLTKESLRRVTDPRLAWCVVGALNNDAEMAVAAALGANVYEAIDRRPQSRDALCDCLDHQPGWLLFAEEKMPLLGLSGLRDVAFADLLQLSEEMRARCGDPCLLHAAWVLYREASRRMDRYGTTMLALGAVRGDALLVPTDIAAAFPGGAERRRAVAGGGPEAIVALRDAAALWLCAEAHCAYTVMERGSSTPSYVGLESCKQAEHSLADALVHLAQRRPRRPLASGPHRHAELESMRDDMREAVEAIERRSLTVVVGPDDAGMCVAAAARRLWPNEVLCVAAFDQNSRAATAAGHHSLPRDAKAVLRQLTAGPATVFVLLRAQNAGSVSLREALRGIPVGCRVVLIGDDACGAAAPLRPDFGRPFAAVCEFRDRFAAVCVGHQLDIGPVEREVERMASASPDAGPRDPECGVTTARDASTVPAGEWDVVLTGSARDRAVAERDPTMRALLRPEAASAAHDAFCIGDLVAVRSGGRDVAAGTLVGVNTGFSCGGTNPATDYATHGTGGDPRPVFRQPKHGTGQGGADVCIELTDDRPYSRRSPRGTGACAGIAPRRTTVSSTDAFPLEHLHFVDLLCTPPFVVPAAVLVVTERTTQQDILAAGATATDRLAIVGRPEAIATAVHRSPRTCSLLAHTFKWLPDDIWNLEGQTTDTS